MSNLATERGQELVSDIPIEDEGDLPLDESAADDARIEEAVRRACADGAVPVLLGGDHAVTYPVLRGIAAMHGPVNILHIDAHPDLYDELGGNRRSHASPFARIMEEGLAHRLVQIGIRTDKVHEVTTLHRGASEQPPMVGMRWRRDYLRELVRRDEGVVLLPDLPAIFRSLDAPARPAEPHLTLIH